MQYNLSMALPEIRPLTFGETLDRSFAFYRSHFLTLALICLFPGLAVTPLNLFFRTPVIKPGVVPDPAVFLSFFATLFGIVLVSTFVSVLTRAAGVFAIAELYLGRPVTIAAAYKHVFQRFWSLFDFWISVMLRYAGSAFTIVLLPLVPLLFLWYAFAIPVLLVERVKAGYALKRSRLLTKGQRGQVFLTYLLMAILIYIVSFVFQSPFIAYESNLTRHGEIAPVWMTLLSGILGALGSAIASPPLIVALTLMYFNTRVIREGYDLQLMMERVGSGTAAGVETDVVADAPAPTRLFGDLTPPPDPEPPAV